VAAVAAVVAPVAPVVLAPVAVALREYCKNPIASRWRVLDLSPRSLPAASSERGRPCRIWAPESYSARVRQAEKKVSHNQDQTLQLLTAEHSGETDLLVVTETDLQVAAETDLQVVAETDLQVAAETDLQVVAETDLQVVAETDLQVVAETDLQVVAETDL